MRPNATPLAAQVKQVDRSISFSISQNAADQALLMERFTSLYSNKLLAALREYSTNAYDSHIEAGISDPIEVTLPTVSDPYFRVRDHGVGLSVDDMVNIYSQYGVSTKRENDEAVGALGLGCKSGLTYTNSFNIFAVKNGVKVAAVIARNEQGVGAIEILDTRSTTEPNGVLIEIPINNDIYNWRSEAAEFFGFWRGNSVLVDGEFPTFALEGYQQIDPDIYISPDRYAESYVVMGNVAYPVPSSHKVSGHAFVAYVPMGSVTFVPSREALMVDDQTVETLRTITTFVEDNLRRVVQTEVDAAPNEWERLKVLHKWKDSSWAPRVSTHVQFSTDGFSEDGYGRFRKARYLELSRLLQRPDRLIVTHYPFRSVSPNNRERLNQIVGSGVRQPVLVPKGTNVAKLEGYPHVLSWAEVMETTTIEKVKADRQVKTTYHVHEPSSYGTSYHSVVEDELPTDKPLVYHTFGKDYTPNEVACQEATILQIRENQVNKLLRLRPDAVEYHRWWDAELRTARQGVTRNDRIKSTVSGSWALLSGAVDPAIQVLATASKGDFSPAAKRLKHLGYGIERDTAIEAKVNEVFERYPLLRNNLGRGYDADLVLYVNAKYVEPVQ